MLVEQALYNLLRNAGPVTLLVGNRIHPSQAPESSAYPAVVYSEASRKQVKTYDGYVPTDRYGMLLQAYGTGYGSVKATGQAMRNALLGYTGEVTGGRILGIFDEDEGDSLDPPLQADERGIFTLTLNLTIWFRATS